ncbi:hypothetical protein [Polynucleobacter necessarius]|uniref:hypothetical protein n=1 Tax=Polynucleobacter necessarius TaxID=576610 RepID=UPI002F92F5CA
MAFGLNEEVEARLVKSQPWSFEQGPFSKQALPSLNKSDWALLLQGMEANHPAAAKALS